MKNNMGTEEDTFLKLKQHPFQEAQDLYDRWCTHPDFKLYDLQIQLREIGWKWKEFCNHPSVEL